LLHPVSVLFAGRPVFDAVVALAVAAWLILSTMRELRVSSGDVLWPEEKSSGTRD